VLVVSLQIEGPSARGLAACQDPKLITGMMHTRDQTMPGVRAMLKRDDHQSVSEVMSGPVLQALILNRAYLARAG